MKRKKLRWKEGFRVAFSNKRAQVAEMVLAGGDAEGGASNRHRNSDQWLYVLSGTGRATINGRRYGLSAGTMLLIEHGDRHEIRSTGRGLLRTLNVYVPPAFDKRGNRLPSGRR